MSKTIEELQQMYTDMRAYERNDFPHAVPYPDNYVFDENQSVKWNREQVMKYNENIKQRFEDYNAMSKKLNTEFNEEVNRYLLDEYDEGDFTLKDVERIKTFMLDADESTYEMDNGVCNYISFIEDILDIIVAHDEEAKARV